MAYVNKKGFHNCSDMAIITSQAENSIRSLITLVFGSSSIRAAEIEWLFDDEFQANNWISDEEFEDERALIPWIGYLDFFCPFELLFVILRFQFSRLLGPFFPVRITIKLLLYGELHLLHPSQSFVWEPSQNTGSPLALTSHS